jgi:uncharacterized membrane protein
MGILPTETAAQDGKAGDVKLTMGKGFLLILVTGLILIGLIAAEPGPLPALLRILLGIPFVLLATGFALQAALFPHHGDLDPLTRAAFSFGLSIAATPILLIALTWMGFGMQFEIIVISLGLLIAACALVYVLRRRGSPEEEHTGAGARADIRAWWGSQDRFSRWILRILGVAIIIAAISGILVAQEAPAEPYTEFYLLDSQGLSMDYPREVMAGASIIIGLGIANHEEEQNLYRIIAVAEEDEVLATSNVISLADGETWQGNVTIILGQAGEGQKVEFLLERIGAPWPYRKLRIWMDVYPADGAASIFPAFPRAYPTPI